MKNKTNFKRFETADNNHEINNLRHSRCPANPKNKTNFSNLPAGRCCPRCRPVRHSLGGGASSATFPLWFPLIQPSNDPTIHFRSAHSVNPFKNVPAIAIFATSVKNNDPHPFNSVILSKESSPPSQPSRDARSPNKKMESETNFSTTRKGVGAPFKSPCP